VKPEGARLPAAGGGDVSVAGIGLVADCAGALYWPDEGLLAVADLHLEKGSSFATRGVLLPPYDTAATLARLGALIARYAPKYVVALGDSFHDGGGPERVSEGDRAMLGALQRGRDWIWIAGNHDPEPVRDLGGISAAMFAIGPLVFRHAPEREEADGEIAGHLHPVARVSGRGRTVSRRCFATDGKRMVMPAFGAYTGGLNIRNAAFADVFGTFKFMAHMLGEGRIYAISAQRCASD
jgi:DNA ligase-associated metallophosphoesterase